MHFHEGKASKLRKQKKILPSRVLCCKYYVNLENLTNSITSSPKHFTTNNVFIFSPQEGSYANGFVKECEEEGQKDKEMWGKSATATPLAAAATITANNSDIPAKTQRSFSAQTWEALP